MLNRKNLLAVLMLTLLFVPLARADIITPPLPYSSNGPISQLILEFISTFIIEFVIVWAFIRKNIRKILLYEFLINLFTWPLATLASNFGIGLLPIEAAVIIVEFILIKLLFDLKYPKSFLISLVANAVSFIIGALFL